MYTFKSTFQSIPDVQIQFRDKFSLSTFQGEFKFHSFKAMKGYLFVCFLWFSWLFIFIHIYVYLCILNTPSYQHFKAFPVSNINSEASFLYQLFKENSNFIVKKPCKVICLSAYVSLFFILLWDKVIYLSMFYDCHYYLYLFICN